MKHSRAIPLNANRIGRNPAPASLAGDISEGFRLALGKRYEVPSVDLVPTNGDEYGGRYFPKYNAILAYHNEHDPDLTRAVLVHEFAHWMTYCTVCRSPSGSSQCGYRGDHDRTFYETVAPFYRAFGVDRELIKIVERGYRYPRSLVE